QFLDSRVVEYANSLPARLKMRVLDEKYLLKRAARGLIPETIRTRKKQPYRAPDATSFFDASGMALDYVSELLAPRRIEEDGIFDPRAVARLMDKVRLGKELGLKDNMGFVGILSMQLLYERFIRNFTHAESSAGSAPIHHRQLPLR